jgi:beta-galactosidase
MVLDPDRDLPDIPRVGMQMKIPEKYENVDYFGRGPQENYIDRCTSADVGMYTSMVSDFGEAYVFPQENANRTGVRWMAFRDGGGTGILVTADSLLSMSAWPCSQDAIEKATHTVELPDEPDHTINIDLVQMGVGGNDTWTDFSIPLPQYMVKSGYNKYSFWIKPVSGNTGDLRETGRVVITAGD